MDKLTLQQQNVVDNRGGTLLVSAAAGSGKTKVLIDRVMSEIMEGASINEFLIITFTNAAAAELRGRISTAIAKALGENPDYIHLRRQLHLLPMSHISTVHAFCGKLIRQYGYILDIPSDYSILDDAEQNKLLLRAVEEVLEQAYESRSSEFTELVNSLGTGRDDESLVQLILSTRRALESQTNLSAWCKAQIDDTAVGESLPETAAGKILLNGLRRDLSGCVSRLEWALRMMEREEGYQKSYVPAYTEVKDKLDNLLKHFPDDWNSVGEKLQITFPASRVKAEDKLLLEQIKEAKNATKKILAEGQKIFGRSEDGLIKLEKVLKRQTDALLDLVLKVEAAFSRIKRQKNVLDFSDQEHLAISLLLDRNGKPTEIAQEISAQFREIMVDEYQDSNRVQEAIYLAITAGNDENRFLVGDIKQSIYGFRQAEPGLFKEKNMMFRDAAEAKPGEARRLVLSRNFRSVPQILEAVNHVFSCSMRETLGDIEYDNDSKLYPGLDSYPACCGNRVELDVIELLKVEDQEELERTKYQREAEWTANRIADMLTDGTTIRHGDVVKKVEAGDIAILLRTNDPLSVYRTALERCGIPVAGGGENLLDLPEAQVVMNFLKIIENPHLDIPLLSVLCSPVFRFSNDDLASIRANSDQQYLYDAMAESPLPGCAALLNLISDFRHRSGMTSADVLLWELLQESGLLRCYTALGQDKRGNLLQLYQFARNEAAKGFLYLYQLNDRLETVREAGTLTAQASGEGVVLTTIHRSKGLEYPVVFLTDLSRKFNFKDLQKNILVDGDLGLACKMTDLENRVRYPGVLYSAQARKKRSAYMSEELRILYVAMTRARDILVMVYCGQTVSKSLCRLLPGAGMPASEWAVQSAACPGDWVLLSALNRMEAGELYSVCGNPSGNRTVSDYPWSIHYLQVPEKMEHHILVIDNKQTEKMLLNREQLIANLSWNDPHEKAGKIPSKLTATQLKGRMKDTEIAETAQSPKSFNVPELNRPVFITEQSRLTPAEKGTATHLFLEHAVFSRCSDLDGIKAERERMLLENTLTLQQADALPLNCILKLFQSDLGAILLESEKNGSLLREFKFSILEEASEYFEGVENEKIMLQGVVDAAIVEKQGLIIVDFKTDHVTEEMAAARAETYLQQIKAYCKAMEEIFARPVKQRFLYFLSPGVSVQI